MIYTDRSRRRRCPSTGPFCVGGENASFGIGTVLTDLFGDELIGMDITAMEMKMKCRLSLPYRIGIAAASAVLTLAMCLSPHVARAKEYPSELLFGVFTQSRLDSTDMLYASRDGVHMELVGSAFRDSTPEYDSLDESGRESVDGQFTLVNPSILWHDGRFWLLGNHHNCDVKNAVCLVVSSSDDLQTWSKQTIVRVPVKDEAPPSNGKDFDAVAADWAEDPVTHTVYAVVSLGNYGAFHGKNSDDMRPYLIPFTTLTTSGIAVRNAMRIHLPYKDDHDRIDGSLYFENGKALYSVKRDGVNNELWSIDKLEQGGDAAKWMRIGSDLALYYEAPSLTYFHGRYRYYFDRLSVYPSGQSAKKITGTYAMSSKSLSEGWNNLHQIVAYQSDGVVLSKYEQGTAETTDGPRHGTVITLRDPQAIRIVMNARNSRSLTDPMLEDTGFIDVYARSRILGDSDTVATPHGDDIVWLADKHISTGYSDGSFRPETKIKRQDMAALLRRMAVRHGVSDASSWKPRGKDWAIFSDVDRRTPHAEDILWVAHAGISTGWRESNGERTFRGSTAVKRQDMAAFLHRLASQSAGDIGKTVPKSNFTDVTAATPHAEDIYWLGKTGISQGYKNSDGGWRFEGSASVHRQDMAAFLHRLSNMLSS